MSYLLLMTGVCRVFACLLFVCSCGGNARRSPSSDDAAGGSAGASGAATLVAGAANASGGIGPVTASGGAATSGGETSNGGDATQAGNGAASTGGNGSQPWATDCPGEPGPELKPAASCSTRVLTCSTDRAQPESCAFSPLSVTLAELASDCSIYCGRMSVGVQAGCIADVFLPQVGVLDPETPEAAVACLKQRLIGTRWDCVSEDGWVEAYLGSCTVDR